MTVKTTDQDLSQKIAYLYSLERFGIKPGLATTQALLSELGNPHTALSSIHIAGTNGKGSTATMLANVFTAAGLTTGLYTSPHLWQFNERVQIDGEPISHAQLEELIEVVRKAADKAKLQPTFFEFTTALAFLYLAQRQVDIALIETGMGGLYDATNVIKPIQSIITNIDLDHTRYLGKTKADIAARKAGIIKFNTPCITAETEPVLINYFSNICRTKKSALWHVDDHIQATGLTSSWQEQSVQITGDMHGKIELPLIGAHQVENLRTALTSLAQLQEQGIKVEWSDVKEGIAQVNWPGRLDVVSHDPFVLVDGAHNAAGLTELAKVVKELPSRDCLVVALSVDKDPALLKELSRLFARVIVTEGDYRPFPAPKLAAQIAKYNSATSFYLGPEQAFAAAQSGSTGANVITGSLYMIPKALKYFA